MIWLRRTYLRWRASRIRRRAEYLADRSLMDETEARALRELADRLDREADDLDGGDR